MISLHKEVCNKISDKEIVVISDRYPPKSFGGAEVSLHAALISGDAKFKSEVLVVFFDSGFFEPTLYTISGITVLGLPDEANWPFNAKSFIRHTKKSKNLIYNKILKYLHLGNRLIRSRFPIAHASAYLLQLRARTRPRGGVRHEFLLNRYDFRASSLSAVIAATKCRKLVADNTRSIVLGAITGKKIQKRVAIVRDNRFNCARHNQIKIVAGNHCDICNFGCASEDSKLSGMPEAMHRKHLQLTQLARSNALSSYSDVVVTSHYLARNVNKVLAGKVPISRIPNPVGDYLEVMEFCRGVAESPSNEILVIGMLNEAKGQLEFIKAAVRWLQRDKSIIVTFAGRGDRIKGAIQVLAKKEGIENSIRFANYVDRQNLFKLLKRSKFALIPGVWKEPFGRVPLEAGLARKAVVSFAVGGICETVIHNRTGILVEPGNYESLIESCNLLLSDGALRHELGANAFDHIVENYSHEQTSQALVEIISTL